MTDHRARLVQKILDVPIHKHIGLTLQSLDETTMTATATFETSAKHLTPADTLHGGLSSLVLDVICFIASTTVLGEDESASTVSSSFQYLSTVMGNSHQIVVKGTIFKKTRSLLFCQSELSCEGKVLAKGLVTKAITKIQPKKSKI